MRSNLPQILIVDDSPENIDVIVAGLKAHYDLITAYNGDEAFNVLATTKPDIILLDVMMPGMSGFDVCKKLKKNPDWKDIPVIFLTALESLADSLKGFEVGAVDYITKPFQLAELRARVKTQVVLQKQFKEIVRLRQEHEAFLRHELNNRLMPIKGYADLLLMNVSLDASNHDILERISNHTKDLIGLVEAMRDLEALEQGRFQIDFISVDLVVLLQSIIDDLMVLFNDIEIDFLCSSDSVQTLADANLLTGAFFNLIKNAVEHILPLEIEEDRYVKVDCSETADGYIVTIYNGGIPIPSERLPGFFEKFNTDRSLKADGTGLGTTYAYWAVRAHDGEIEVASDEETGTIVTVLLPKKQSDKQI